MAENVDIIVRGKDHASKAFDSARQSLDGLGKSAGKGAGGAARALDGLSNATAGAASRMGGLASAVGGVGTALAGAGIAAAAGAIVVSIGAIGAALMDVSGKADTARTALQKLDGVSIDSVLSDASLLSARYGADLNEVLDATRTLMDEFGLTSEEATGILIAGFDQGLNVSDDFLDSISEYSNLMADNGFTAAEFFSIMETGMAGGVLGTDKAADALKEFGIRVREIPNELFGPQGSLIMSGMFTGAELDAMVEGFENGTVSMADAFNLIMPRLREIDNEIERNTIGTKLFGTQWEDLGMSAMLGIDTATTSMEDLNAAAAAGRNQFGSLGEIAPRLWSEFTIGLLPAADIMLELANRAAPALLGGMRSIGGYLSTFGAALSAATGEGGALSGMMTAAAPLLERLGAGAAVLGRWFTGTVVPAVMTFATAIGTTLPPVIEALTPVITTLIDTYLARLASYLEAGAWLWTNVLGPAIVSVAGWFMDDLTPALTTAANLIGDALAPHIATMAEFLTGSLIPAVMDFGAKMGEWIVKAIERVTPLVIDLANWFVTKLMPALRDGAATIMGTLIPRLNDLWNLFTTKILPIIMKVVGWIGDNLPGAIAVLSPIIATLIDVGLTNFKTILEGIVTVWTTLLQPAFEKMFTWIGDLTGGWDNLSRGAGEAQRLIGIMTTKVRDLFSLQLPAWMKPDFKMPKFEMPDFKMPSIPGFAGGVRNFSGGAAVVGERGPELVTLPRGSNVIPAPQTRQLMAQAPSGGGMSLNLTVAPVINGMTVDNADRVRQVASEIAATVRNEMTREFSRAIDGLILGGGAV